MPVRLGTYLGTDLGTYLGQDPDGSELAGIESFLAANLFSWMRADYRTESGGKVTAFWDKVATGVGARAIDANHAFAQGNSGNQVAAVATSAAFGNQPVASFAKSPATYYDSTISPSAWTSWHDGAGGYMLLIASSAGVGADVIATTRTSTTGATIYRLSSTNSAFLFVGNGGATVVSIGNATAWSGNTPVIFRGGFNLSDTPDARLYKSGVAIGAGGDVSSSASPGDPQITMRIGFADGTNGISGPISDMFFVKADTFSTALEQKILRYAYLRYGLT